MPAVQEKMRKAMAVQEVQQDIPQPQAVQPTQVDKLQTMEQVLQELHLDNQVLPYRAEVLVAVTMVAAEAAGMAEQVLHTTNTATEVVGVVVEVDQTMFLLMLLVLWI